MCSATEKSKGGLHPISQHKENECIDFSQFYTVLTIWRKLYFVLHIVPAKCDLVIMMIIVIVS
jgi:hypothetical protein